MTIEKTIEDLGYMGKAELKKALKLTSEKSKDFAIPASDRKFYKNLAAMFRKELKEYADNPERRKNPKRRKKMTRKKRRTPAQIAATKKLVAFNKKRRGKKTVKKTRKKRRTPAQITATRKLVARNRRLGPKLYRRKNPKRKVPGREKTLAKSHLFVVFRCRGKSVAFLGVTAVTFGLGWKPKKADSVKFPTSASALIAAKVMGRKRGASKYQIGIVDDSATAAQITAYCTKA